MMKQILSEAEDNIAAYEDIARSLYRKSHNHYEPSEQITRNYEWPFDKSQRFGKPRKGHESESRVKRILTWINLEPVTLVNRLQADFIDRTRPSVGRIRDPEASRFYADVVHGKKNIKDEFDVSDTLHDSGLNQKTLLWWRYLRDLNNFRRTLKKRFPEVPFGRIEDDLSCLDKECTGLLPEDRVFAILEKYRVYSRQEFFIPLMDALELREDGNINYRGLLNLLNWRRGLPDLPKVQQASLASSDYVTIYGNSIGSISTCNNTKIHAAGLPSAGSDKSSVIPADTCSDRSLDDQTFIHCSTS